MFVIFVHDNIQIIKEVSEQYGFLKHLHIFVMMEDRHSDLIDNMTDQVKEIITIERVLFRIWYGYESITAMFVAINGSVEDKEIFLVDSL